MTSRFLAPPVALAIVLATPLAAQVAPLPLATPSATPTPAVTLPASDSAVPPPVTVTLPEPTARPTPASSPTAREAPAARATPILPRVADPRPASTPVTGDVPPAIDRPSPAPTTVETPEAPVTEPPTAVVAGRPATALPLEDARGPLWMLPVSGGLVAGIVLVALLVRRRRRRAMAGEGEDLPPVDDGAVTTGDATVPDAPIPPPARSRADVSFVLRPLRTGVNLLTATLDAQVIVRNDGETAVDQVRVDVRLLSARAQQEAELDAVFADQGGRAVAPPFTLAPGEERTVSTLATCARQDLNVVTAGDRPMFVPVATVSIRYLDGDRAAQVAQAFALGVERVGAEKLAPVWLDAPSRMHDAVGARPYAPEVRR